MCRDDVEQGIEVLHAGIAGWQKTGAKLWMPIFCTMEAEAYAKAGRSDVALQAIHRALAVSEKRASAGRSPKCCASRPGCSQRQA
jgi:predicted ATPase